MTAKSWIRLAQSASISLLLSACTECGTPTASPPTVEATGAAVEASGAPADSGFQVHGAAAPAGAVEGAPENLPLRGANPHTTPPAPADFAVAPVVGDWIGWRGNTERSGLREAPGIARPRVAWAIDVGIQGYANTPVVTADTVYVASQGGTHNQRRGTADERDGVLALDAATGAQRWRFATDTDANGLTLAGDALLVTTDSGALLALETTNGQQRWRVETGCMLAHGPLVVGDEAWVVRRDGVLRVNLTTGAPSARLPEACPGEERGAASRAGDDVFVASAGRELERWTPAAPVWTARDTETPALRGANWTAPLLTESLALVAYDRWPFADGTRRQALVAFWRDSGHPVWAHDINDPATSVDDRRRPTPFLRSTAWVYGDRAFWTPTTRPEIAIISLVDGSRVGGIALDDCRRRQFASIVGTPTTGYLARHDGMLYAFSIENPAIVWRLQLGLHGMAGADRPAISVTAGCSELPDDGSALFATPAIGADGTLYVPAGDGWLYAIRDESW